MEKEIKSSRDVIIQTNDWPRAIEFYEKTMGFPVTHRGPGLLGFETGSFCLYVEKGGQPGPVFDFLVPDMGETRNRLTAAGCTIIDDNPALPRCYFKDPFGLVFNIEQAAGDAGQGS